MAIIVVKRVRSNVSKNQENNYQTGNFLTVFQFTMNNSILEAIKNQTKVSKNNHVLTSGFFPNVRFIQTLPKCHIVHLRLQQAISTNLKHGIQFLQAILAPSQLPTNYETCNSI